MRLPNSSDAPGCSSATGSPGRPLGRTSVRGAFHQTRRSQTAGCVSDLMTLVGFFLSVSPRQKMGSNNNFLRKRRGFWPWDSITGRGKLSLARTLQFQAISDRISCFALYVQPKRANAYQERGQIRSVKADIQLKTFCFSKAPALTEIITET